MSLDEAYPQSCPFCKIAAAYPAPHTPSPYQDAIPEDVDVAKVQPSCFLVLSAPDVMAFLDIQPMTRGHLLVCVRGHREKIEHLAGGEAKEVGECLFPPLFSLLLVREGGLLSLFRLTGE